MAIGCPECGSTQSGKHQDTCTWEERNPTIAVLPAGNKQPQVLEEAWEKYVGDIDYRSHPKLLARDAFVHGYLAHPNDLDEAQRWFVSRLRMYGGGDLQYLAGKLNEEAGEVIGKILKVIRDDFGYGPTSAELSNWYTEHPKERKDLGIEASDPVWYVIILAAALGLDFSEIINFQKRKIIGRQARGTDHGSGDNR